MRLFIVILLSLFFISTQETHAFGDESYGTVRCRTFLNFRAGPGTNFETIGQLPCEADIKVLGIQAGHWAKVEYQGVVGYAHTDYMDLYLQIELLSGHSMPIEIERRTLTSEELPEILLARVSEFRRQQEREQAPEQSEEDDSLLSTVADTIQDTTSRVTSGKTLIIGDSNTVGSGRNSFGQKLAESITEELESPTYVYAYSGATVRDFNSARTHSSPGYLEQTPEGRNRENGRTRVPSITNLINNIEPERAIVALGANDMGASNSFIRNNARALIETLEATATECIWVGPGDRILPQSSYGNLDRFYNNLNEVNDELGSYCQIIDSRPESMPFLVFPRSGCGDNIHWHRCGARGVELIDEWVEEIINQI